MKAMRVLEMNATTPTKEAGRSFTPAPEIAASSWLNVDEPLSIASLRGKVIALHVFQMLCPGCVSHGLPQARAMAELASSQPLKVIGLHSVFEHHDAMGPSALAAFVQQYRLTFPIAIDQPGHLGSLPVTMEKLALEGTPSLVLIDKLGRIRLSHFGWLNDMQVGLITGRLLMEPYSPER